MSDRHETWRRVYAGRRRELAAYAIALVGAEDAEDVLHDAMLKLVRQGARPHDACAYAFAAVRTAAMDRLARRSRLARDGGAPCRRDFLDDAPSGIENAERADLVRGAMASLSDRQRETLLLRIWCGLTLAQTAEATGRPLGAVASDHRRALLELRATLDTEMNHDAR